MDAKLWRTGPKTGFRCNGTAVEAHAADGMQEGGKDVTDDRHTNELVIWNGRGRVNDAHVITALYHSVVYLVNGPFS